VRRRVAFDDSATLPELFEQPPFERQAADAPYPCTVYALRLGSEHYPHLKLQIRPFPNRQGFVFWVDTHDQVFAEEVAYRDADRWRQLVARNRDAKHAIEQSWEQRGLPTFAGSIREDLSQGGPGRAAIE